MPDNTPGLRTINIDRYVLPLREGGSLPGLVEADDHDKYVIKFRGAAQGPKVLISELIGGEIARTLGLNVPEIVFAKLDSTFGRTESDQELQDQFRASEGLNLGLRYLPGCNTFDPTVTNINGMLASQIVWLDCLMTNIDRTVRNTNMLIWNKCLWLIDHGASLYFHFNWVNPAKQYAIQPFGYVAKHVLLPSASRLKAADSYCTAILTKDVIHNIVTQIPDDWLAIEAPFNSTDDYRRGYEEFLLTRIANSAIFVKEAIHARKKAI